MANPPGPPENHEKITNLAHLDFVQFSRVNEARQTLFLTASVNSGPSLRLYTS